MSAKIDENPKTKSADGEAGKFGTNAEFLDDARRELAKQGDRKPPPPTQSATQELEDPNQSVSQIRQINLRQYFAIAKELAPNTSPQARDLYLEYALHYSEKILRARDEPFNLLNSIRDGDRLEKLNLRMHAIEARLAQLGIPMTGLESLGAELDKIAGPNSPQPSNGTSRASLIVEKAPKLVAEILQRNPISFASRLNIEMTRTHQILDPLPYYYGGQGNVAAPQIRDQSFSRLDRSSYPSASRNGGRNFRSRTEQSIDTKIDCSHYAYFQRQAVARAANMSEEWIRKNIKYKDSATMSRQGCMSVKSALTSGQIREGDVLVYPGHAAVVGRDKDGVMCILESTTTKQNSRTGRAESGVQISDFDQWIKQRIGKSARSFVVYRDNIPASS